MSTTFMDLSGIQALCWERRSLGKSFLCVCSKHGESSGRVSKKFHLPNRNLLKAREQTVKHYSKMSPLLTPEDKAQLSENQTIGMVVSAQANFMRVFVQSNLSESLPDDPNAGVELLCVVRQVLKKIKRRVLVGDKVVVGEIDWVDQRGVIKDVFERATETVDPPVANVDHLLVLFSMEQPKVEPFSLTMFLVEAESAGIPLTLALNKMELVSDETLQMWKSRLHNWGYEPVFCSVESKHGLDTLQNILKEQTSVIVGPSGVGKSSLINVLRSSNHVSAEFGNWFDSIIGSKWSEEQRVGEVSSRSGRGKHTTRHVSLLPLSGGGYLADTPGFNQPSLMKVTKQSLAQHFPEIQRKLKESELTQCSFNDCVHLGEPGCIVQGDWERYPYYLQLYNEIKTREEVQLRTFGTKREGDVRYKAGNMGSKKEEPKLDPKKYRRQSRKKMNQSLPDELDGLDDDDDEV